MLSQLFRLLQLQMITTRFQQVLRTAFLAGSERVGFFYQAIVYEHALQWRWTMICTLAKWHVVPHARAVVEAVAEVHKIITGLRHSLIM